MSAKPTNASSVTLSEREPGVATLRIGRDARPYLDATIIEPLRSAVTRIAEDESIHAVIVEGGSKAFCMGASRESLMDVDVFDSVSDFCADVPELLMSIAVPTVAAMSGHGVGGGLLVGLWCDTVVLAEESLYGTNFIQLGFTPGMGSTYVVEEVFGGALAREMLFGGKLYKGRELRDAGAPVRIVPRRDVVETAESIVEDMASAPRPSLVQLKSTTSAIRKSEFEAARQRERAMHEVVFNDPATRARIAREYKESDE